LCLSETEMQDDNRKEPSQVTAVLGVQWGDEGKGKLIDILASSFDIVARCQGGETVGLTLAHSIHLVYYYF